jgi:EAL domain-containing protein (putative c-di-GMP-specific phosphodiesterase class I)
VLRKACELGARWPGRTIAINISPMQLRNPKFPARVFATLKKSGMRPVDLELEITENILLADEQTTSETLRTFRAAGIKIALDDFGTGYSSLNYLKRYAVDRIKIDRSFVGQMPEDAVSVAIVQAMMTLAGAMNIDVTAEGVETAAQRDALVALGCDALQGYLYSPAIPVELVEELFRDDAAGILLLEKSRLTA